MGKIVKTFIKQYLISLLPIILLFFYFSIKDDKGLMIMYVFLIFSLIVNLFISLFFSLLSEYISKLYLIIINTILFFGSIYFFNFILKNENDFNDYENWQFYNRQTLISPKIDYFIGENYIGLEAILIVILLNIITSFILLFLRKKKPKEPQN